MMPMVRMMMLLVGADAAEQVYGDGDGDGDEDEDAGGDDNCGDDEDECAVCGNNGVDNADGYIGSVSLPPKS